MWGLSKIGEKLKAFSSGQAGGDTSVRTETFNDYLRRVIFPKEQYELRRVVFPNDTFDWSMPASETKGPDEGGDPNTAPVYTFRCNKTGKEFLVDADFRETLYYPDRIEWCRPGRLKRYKEVASTGIPFFLTLGLGRKGQEPESVFVIPVSQTTSYSGLCQGSLATYAFPTDEPIVPDHLWRLCK